MGLYQVLINNNIRPGSENMKDEVNTVIEKKVFEVKLVLENLSQIYEDKVKKSTLSQIEKLMGIIRAKNKNIYITKKQ